MNIFILEDDFIQQTRIESVIESILDENKINCKFMEVFSNPRKLYEAIREKGDHQLFFLDIEIQGESRKGLELATEIRQKDPNAVIVFVTTHSEFAPISYKYKVSALDFIDKSVDTEQFKEQIEECIFYTNEMMSKNEPEDLFIFETPQTKNAL